MKVDKNSLEEGRRIRSSLKDKEERRPWQIGCKNRLAEFFAWFQRHNLQKGGDSCRKRERPQHSGIVAEPREESFTTLSTTA
eukprot:2041077-Rhodomonas_salina.2